MFSHHPHRQTISTGPNGIFLLRPDLIREFDFNNSRRFYFELEARTNGYFLEILNFNFGGVAPVLYDMQTLERYTGDIALAGVVRFALKGL